MKILELQLTAFGPFTNRSLDLGQGSQGLHVIYGRNEAGKSSALRALEALLFGMDARTADAFIHPYPKLRLGARLRLSTGEELQFTRRKSPKGSLSGPGDSKLPDDALDHFLCGVRRVYCVGHTMFQYFGRYPQQDCEGLRFPWPHIR